MIIFKISVFTACFQSHFPHKKSHDALRRQTRQDGRIICSYTIIVRSAAPLSWPSESLTEIRRASKCMCRSRVPSAEGNFQSPRLF